MKTMRQYLAKLTQFLLWTPANALQLSATSHINSWELFSKFQKQEEFFQLKVVLIGVVGFATLLGVTSIPLQNLAEYKFAWVEYFVQYYSLVTAVGHVLLVSLAILGEYLQRFTVLQRPFIYAVTSYVAMIPLMTGLLFSRQMLNARLYLTATSLMYIVATVYFQKSFLISLFIWLTILLNGTIYLARSSEVEQVSQYACMTLHVLVSFTAWILN